mmetsp:Transcript_13359/g.23485  ORF Transcript_13359/g.23485 Transcript_13359/m.23485 type:complete len:329 (+) Transcript_13359:401-1387(+)
MRSYSARAALMLHSSLAQSPFSSSTLRARTASPPNTRAPAVSSSCTLRCRTSKSAANVSCVSSCFSRVDSPLMAAGSEARWSCKTESSPAARPTARRWRREARTSAAAAAREPTARLCDWRTVPVDCARCVPSPSSNLHSLKIDSPVSPWTAATRSIRCTSFSAARDARASASLKPSSRTLSPRSSTSPAGTGGGMPPEEFAVSPPPPPMACAVSFIARIGSDTPLVGCTAWTGSRTDLSSPSSCLLSRAVPSTSPAGGAGSTAIHAPAVSSSPSASRNTRSSSHLEATGCCASRFKYRSSASLRSSTNPSAMRCPSTAFFSGRGGRK